jgi:hypothetical protein
MIALLSLLLPIAAGWVWCRALHVPRPGLGLLGFALRGGLAIALGLGASSTLFFFLTLMGLANLPAIALCEIALLAAGMLLMRSGSGSQESAKQDAPSAGPLTGIHYALVAAVLLLAGLAGAIVSNTYAGAPHGRWDAWAIWNLRAKYVAGEGTWENAVSPLLAETHPEYPLGTPSLIARTWVYGGRDFDPAVPACISALYALATLLLLVGALGTTRGPTLGLLAGCVLLSAQSWVGEVGAQYADIAVGSYFAAALALLALALAAPNEASSRVCTILAGVCAGFGAFVKNEGLAFAVMVLVALAVSRLGRRRLPAFAIGLAPGLLLVLIFKFFIAAHDPEVAQSVRSMAAKVADFSRWGAIFGVFGARVWTLGEWYAHPLVLAAAAWFWFRPTGPRTATADRPFQQASPLQQALPLWIACGLMLAMYFGAYLITPADLKWQLDTSMDRLLVQLLPAVLMSLLFATATEQAPQVAAVAEAVRPTSGNRKFKKKAAQKA